MLYVYIAVGPLALTPPDSPALEKGAHKRRGWLPEKATARDEGAIRRLEPHSRATTILPERLSFFESAQRWMSERSATCRGTSVVGAAGGAAGAAAGMIPPGPERLTGGAYGRRANWRRARGGEEALGACNLGSSDVCYTFV